MPQIGRIVKERRIGSGRGTSWVSTNITFVMYAVIASGGKQEKAEVGSTINVELLDGAEAGKSVSLTPVLLVDGATVLAGDKLGKATVEGKVLGQVKGVKINGFNYKNKSRQSKRWGHRQKYTQVEITSISAGK